MLVGELPSVRVEDGLRLLRTLEDAADPVDGKAEFAQARHQLQAAHVRLGIVAILVPRVDVRGDESLLLIKANGAARQARPLADLLDFHRIILPSPSA